MMGLVRTILAHIHLFHGWLVIVLQLIIVDTVYKYTLIHLIT